MTTRVVCVPESASLVEAAHLLRDHQVSGMPVVGKGLHVVGVISETDLLREISRALRFRVRSSLLEFVLEPSTLKAEEMRDRALTRLTRTFVGDAMSAKPVTVGPDDDLESARRLMRDRKINRLPVVEGGQLVGIVTRQDLLAET